MSNIVSFDHLKDQYLYFHDFYQGGEKIKNPSSVQVGTTTINRKAYNSDLKEYYTTSHNVRSYLIPFDGEDDAKFKSRMQGAYYFNLVSQVVNAYSDAVTSKVTRNLGLLEPFVNNNVDYRDSTWSEFVNQNAKMTALFGLTATYVDFAIPEEVKINSRNDLLTGGISPKCILISPLSFAWMKVNHYGEVEEFAWYENFVDDVGYSANIILRIVDKVGWKQVGIENVNTSKNIHSQVMADATVISEGKHSKDLGGKLPIVFNYYERDYNTSYPQGKSLIADLVDTARAVYNYSSWASDIHQRASFPILTVPLSRTGGVMPPKVELAVGTNNALPYDSDSGTPNFISAPTEPTKELRDHINFIIQRSYQQLGLSLSVDSSSQIQSGEALKIRSREFESYASKFASFMLKFEMKVLDIFKLYLKMEDVSVTISYPKTFSIPQTSEDIQNAQTLLSVPFISDEGKIAALNQMVSVALSIDDDKLNSIIESSKALLESQQSSTTPNK